MKEAEVMHHCYVRVGSIVRVLKDAKGYVENPNHPFVQVIELLPEAAVLDAGGTRVEVPYKALLWCGKLSQDVCATKLDSVGRDVTSGGTVRISSYGQGVVSPNDLGATGTVLKLNPQSAKVSFVSDYAKVKNIPYSYLTVE